MFKCGELINISVGDPSDAENYYRVVTTIPMFSTGNFTYMGVGINPNPAEKIDIVFIWGIEESKERPGTWAGKRMDYLDAPVTMESLMAKIPPEYLSMARFALLSYNWQLQNMLRAYRSGIVEEFKGEGHAKADRDDT